MDYFSGWCELYEYLPNYLPIRNFENDFWLLVNHTKNRPCMSIPMSSDSLYL
jgi:hypothetical protein